MLIVLAAFSDEEIEAHGSEAAHSEPRDLGLVASGFHVHPLPGEGHLGPALPPPTGYRFPIRKPHRAAPGVFPVQGTCFPTGDLRHKALQFGTRLGVLICAFLPELYLSHCR